MPILDELELDIQSYFEKLEMIGQDYTWENKLQLESLSKLFNEFANKLKSFHSLYPDKKVRETSGDQLLSFLSNINIFISATNDNFIENIFFVLNNLKTNLFHILTNNQSFEEFQKEINDIILPEFDFTFVRFFYSQIIDRWVIGDGHYFDIFLTDVQKISEIIPLFKQMFSIESVSALRLGKVTQVSSSINKIVDQIETKLLIIPPLLSEQWKELLIDFLSLVHKFPDIIVLQFDLENLNNELLNKNLLFSDAYSLACKNQVEIIRTIKKKIDLDKEFFKKYEIDDSVYNTKISQLEQMIFAHNNILDHLKNSEEGKSISVDLLIRSEVSFLELLKNNLNLFIPEIKKILLNYIDGTIYLIDWWNNTKKNLLHQGEIYFLMFENLPQTEKIQLIKDIKTKYFRNLFLNQKRFFLFIEEVTADLIPIFDHFTVIHKTIFNGLRNFDKWDEVEKSDPIKNAKAIIEAVIQFFNRWNDQNLQTAFQSHLDSYINNFIPFYDKFAEFYNQYTEMKKIRFNKPEKSIKIINSLLEELQNSETLIYKLFSSNLDLIKSIDKLRIELASFKVLILYYDKLDQEILKILSQNWDSSSLMPFLRLMNEHIEKFPGSPENFANREKLKVITLYNFIIGLNKIEDYLNDGILGTIANIEKFSVIHSNLQNSKELLLNLYILVPENKKDVIESFNSNLNQFFNVISVTWLKTAKNIELFLINQSKNILLEDRKKLLKQLENNFSASLNFLFTWPVFENHFKKLDKEFFPRFKEYFFELVSLEEHWEQSIANLFSNKNLGSLMKSLYKETDNFISKENLEENTNPFFIKINKILEKRLELLKSPPEESLLAGKMKELII